MSEDRPTIRINKADLIRQEKPLSPKELKLRDLSSSVLAMAREGVKNSSTLSEFMAWQNVGTYGEPVGIEWMVDVCPEITPEEIVAERMSHDFSKEAEIATSMLAQLEKAESKPNQVAVLLKRIRSKGGHSWTYRALAKFPVGTKVSDPFLGSDTQSDQSTVYFQPEAACVEHACDDLYKENPSHLAYLPNWNVVELHSILRPNTAGVIEYVIATDTEGVKTKQNNQAQLLMGLLGGYSNETTRIRISDYQR